MTYEQLKTTNHCLVAFIIILVIACVHMALNPNITEYDLTVAAEEAYNEGYKQCEEDNRIDWSREGYNLGWDDGYEYAYAEKNS